MSNPNRLHVVSFDIPYPADYGGAIDVFYKLKGLHNAGCRVILHCFEYGRERTEMLEKYCERVHYYRRSTGIMGISLKQPYIVSSRHSEHLLLQLESVNCPILFEGIHTTGLLTHSRLRNHKKYIRIHNIEHQYYKYLAGKEPNLLKRIYFNQEGKLLARYEKNLQQVSGFFALSQEDSNYFQAMYPTSKHLFIPPFHQYEQVSGRVGTGGYCLYHGNLSHPENREAALFLLRHVIPQVKTKFIIAGKNPGREIMETCARAPNCELIPNPDNARMARLVGDAHIHVLPTFQESGMKLKLLEALFGGRHVLVNNQMLFGTGIGEPYCHIATNAEEFIQSIGKLISIPFSEQDKQIRITGLQRFNNAANAQLLLKNLS